jgi:MerR family mercuric resistance operon transcriptional regulator
MGREMPHIMTIGQLAEDAGVNVETVRFYERKGLITQPSRPETGYRRYDQQTSRRIRFIREAQELGFSLTEIRQLLSLRVDPKTSCAQVKDAAESKIVSIDEKISTLKTMRKALVEITNTCSGTGPTTECPILDALDRAANRKKGGEEHGTKER